MSNNHKQGQAIRRLKESLARTDSVQEQVIDVVVDHSQRLNDLDRRVSEMEKGKVER